MTLESNTTGFDSPLLGHYVAQMTALQETVSELQRSLQQLRQDAKTDGYNLDAMNLLAQIRSKTHPDGGVRLLNDLVRYAHAVGMELDLVPRGEVQSEVKHHGADAEFLEEGGDLNAARAFAGATKFIMQLTIGALLTGTLLWYLH